MHNVRAEIQTKGAWLFTIKDYLDLNYKIFSTMTMSVLGHKGQLLGDMNDST